jgi:hypothetical protein
MERLAGLAGHRVLLASFGIANEVRLVNHLRRNRPGHPVVHGGQTYLARAAQPVAMAGSVRRRRCRIAFSRRSAYLNSHEHPANWFPRLNQAEPAYHSFSFSLLLAAKKFSALIWAIHAD